MAKGTTKVGFEEKLWIAADKLRSNMDAAEYKHVVLGLIFLKYVSDSFEERYEQLKAEGYGDEEDRDEYDAHNIFWVPKEARWEKIKSHATSTDIGEVIDAAMEAIERIRQLCMLMKYQLYRGNITEFGQYLSEQFELVKKLDKGASNTCIEYIFDVCDDLIDGKSICGAGGGGFLQVILKKGVTKEQLKARINSEFLDCGVEVWVCNILF